MATNESSRYFEVWTIHFPTKERSNSVKSRRKALEHGRTLFSEPRADQKSPLGDFDVKKKRGTANGRGKRQLITHADRRPMGNILGLIATLPHGNIFRFSFSPVSTVEN
jgi:hypothetical protein